MSHRPTLNTVLILLLANLFIVGCASKTTKPYVDDVAVDEDIKNIDPWENFNRHAYAFNEKLDAAILLPATNVYTAITPDVVEQGISNFFSNLTEVRNLSNHLLQGKVIDSVHSTARFMVNSTFGIGGFFDFASFAGMDQRPEDFGQTLGVWGVSSGPYIVLPLLGPSTLRDTAAIPVDSRTDMLGKVIAADHQTSAQVIRILNARKGLKSFDALLFGDQYAFVRDAYLSRRLNKINDGAIISDELSDDELFDEFD